MMSSQPAAVCHSSPQEHWRYAREVLRGEARALEALADQLCPETFDRAVRLILECRGRVVVSGMGKAGHVGRKIAATLASTGTPSHFLHPAEAVHGDLGALSHGDVLLVFSFSGETEEILRLLPSFRTWPIPLIAVTANTSSSLAREAQVVLPLGPLEEACALGLAPSTTTTAMLGLGDALALVVSRARGFGPQDFVRFHPGGSLGRKLTRVEEVARPLAECRLAPQSATLREVIIQQSRPGRRTGAIMLVDDQGRLRGIFTDSDLARLMGQGQEAALDAPVEHVMTKTPKTVRVGSALDLALELLERHRISELPVVDEEGLPLGLIDITDLIGSPGCQRIPAVGSAAGRPALTVRFPEPNEPELRS